ncbi:hypothetical protein FOVG_19921 [Fusarium oxysporum f. sp. pisi HDV247]|uniref:Uncharacterized protein n=1 Tax=Fusarium oxysporum f. sp. pisi HDV247 TaxID=1080344 RepID=W9NCP9_FUSOX|nr:hypothetical protein FOVG_19921 [Fusarium oxysporum f. sp. pisi HDV247]
MMQKSRDTKSKKSSVTASKTKPRSSSRPDGMAAPSPHMSMSVQFKKTTHLCSILTGNSGAAARKQQE